MKQKALALFLAVVMAVSLLPMSALAAGSIVDSGTCGANGDNLTWTLDDSGTLTISGTGEMCNYSYNSRAPWDSHEEAIKTVIISDGVTSIGDWAFMRCSKLSSVSIGNSVTSIGDYAFEWCSSLTDITIPNSVTSIGDYAFWGCSSLTSISIPNSVTSIGNYAFESCSSLTDITIPNSVTSIEDHAFSGCSSLTDITIPNSVTSIGIGAFAFCSSLTDTSIPNSVTSIGNDAFWQCSSLTDITIPNSVNSIGDYAFGYCQNLTSVSIGNGVTSIGAEAFEYCDSLTSIAIPNSVTSIGDRAFYHCSSLTDITIPNSVTSIGNSAFSGCSSLNSVSIGNNVTSIGNYVFGGCSSLNSISVNPENPSYSSVNGVFFNKEQSVLIQYPEAKTNSSYTIPNSVTSIENYAFAFCSSLTDISIPNSVTSIGNSTFGYCDSLTDTSIPNSVTSIGNYAFAFCSSLTDIIIPNSVTYIWKGAFKGCSSLSSIDIPNSVTYIGEGACQDCSSLTTVSIPDSVTYIDHWAFSGCDSLASIDIPNNVTSIEANTFKGCSNLTSIDIPDSVTFIGRDAFCSCSSLTDITIPNSVTYIGDQAFLDCDSLTDVYYSGNEEQWKKINIGSNNSPLLNATIHYNGSSGSDTKANRYIIEQVQRYTSQKFYDEWDAYFRSVVENNSPETQSQKFLEFFQNRGFLELNEGFDFFRDSNNNRFAYRFITNDPVYLAANYSDWLHNSKKGAAARAVLIADGLIFNNELSDWIDPTTHATGNYPGVKKYKDMLYDFLDAVAFESETMSYIADVTSLSSKATSAGKIYADDLIKKIDTCKDRNERNALMHSADAMKVYQDCAVVQDPNDPHGLKLSFSLDESSGFGQFSKAMGLAQTSLSAASVTIDHAIDLFELNGKLKVYEQYRGFLDEAVHATDLPLELRLAAVQVLDDMELGAWNELKNFALDLVSLSGAPGQLTDAILKESLGSVAASSVSQWLTAIQLEAWCINKIVDVGALVRGISYVEGYAFLETHYRTKLEANKDAFLANPSAQNAWDFFQNYNLLYQLRYKGEKAYLGMSKIQGIASYFTDFGYSLKEDCVNDTLKTLEERCQFKLDEGIELPPSVQYPKKAIIACPVNVDVYAPDGTHITTLKDGVESDVSNQYGHFAVVRRSYNGEFAKVLCFALDGDYQIKITGTDNGLVSMELGENKNGSFQSFSMNHVEIQKGSVLQTSTDAITTQNSYQLDLDGNGTFETQGTVSPVDDSKPVRVSSIALDQTQAELTVGQSATLNYTLSPAETTNQNVTWLSNNPSVVSVVNGKITAIAEGSAKIHCVPQDNTDLIASCDVTVKKVPEPPKTYSVTYTDGVDNAELFKDQVHKDLTAGTKTPAFKGTPSREGYTFKGWSPAVADTVTKSVTYTAQWEQNLYSVTYTDGVDNVEVFKDQVNKDLTTGTKTPAFKGTPSREGYTFKGWSPAVADTVTKSVTYTATWEQNLYTVTYTDGVDNAEVFKDQVHKDLASGTKTPAFKGTPSREGYTFKGWSPAVADTVTKSVTYTATWEQNLYSVTYTDGVDNTEVFKDQVYNDLTFGAKTPQFNGTPTREGYTFKGWEPKVEDTVTQSATYTAIWEQNVTPPEPPKPDDSSPFLKFLKKIKAFFDRIFS